MIEVSEYDAAVLIKSVVLDDAEPGDRCLDCEALIGSPPDMQAHLDDCPMKSGLYTMQNAVDDFVCGGCGQEHVVHYTCCRCHLFFEDDDPYRLVDDATGLLVPYAESPATATAVCVECAQRQTDALMERLGFP